MHILLIVSWYKTPQNPVTGTFFEEQARMLKKQGHQVGILFPQHNLRFLGNSRYKLEVFTEEIFDDGIPTYYTSTQSLVPKIETPTKIDIAQVTFSAYKKYREYVKKNGKPDVIHAHSVTWGGIVANYISQKENIPYFITKHFSGWIIDNKRIKSRSYRKLIRESISNSKKTFVVSSSYKNELLKKYSLVENDLTVIPNMVSSIFYENRKKIILGEPIKLIVIAYLVEGKNHLTLFEAIRLIKEKGISIRLQVIGNGPYEKTLRDYVLKNGLEKEIEFSGLLNREEIVQQINNTHIVISASAFETFGVNIIEGLAMGRPCLVLDSGGPRDIMRKQDGILLSENTPQAFANAIENIISNFSSYDQDEIANSCISRFGEKNIYSQLMNHYDLVIPNSAS